jgi:hypothetical protein
MSEIFLPSNPAPIVCKRSTTMAKGANEEIHRLALGMHDKIPLDSMFEACKNAGFTFDPEEEGCMLLGREGQARWKLYRNGKLDRYLCLSWYTWRPRD